MTKYQWGIKFPWGSEISVLGGDEDQILSIVDRLNGQRFALIDGTERTIDSSEVTLYRRIVPEWEEVPRAQDGAAIDALPQPTEPGHNYLSTGCLHGEHEYCRCDIGQFGPKEPGQCKFCSAPCRCYCHEEVT